LDSWLLSRRYLLGRSLRELGGRSTSALLSAPGLGLSALLSRRMDSLLGPLTSPLLRSALSGRSTLLRGCLGSRSLGRLPLADEGLLWRLRGALGWLAALSVLAGLFRILSSISSHDVRVGQRSKALDQALTASTEKQIKPCVSVNEYPLPRPYTACFPQRR